MEQRADRKKSEISRQRSGVMLISDLRLLVSMINGFNGFNDSPVAPDYGLLDSFFFGYNSR